MLIKTVKGKAGHEDGQAVLFAYLGERRVVYETPLLTVTMEPPTEDWLREYGDETRRQIALPERNVLLSRE